MEENIMKKVTLFSWLSIVMLAVLVAGCQSADNNQVETNDNNQPKTEETSSYTVKDDRGKEVKLEKIPETVISLQPSNTETLFALGVGDKVIAVNEFDNYPEETSKLERVADAVNINAERILELNPDVVFAFSNGDETAIKPIEDAGIPVFIIQSALTFEDVYDDIKQISEVMGVKDKGEELAANIQTKVTEVENKLADIDKKQRVYFEISPSPDIYTTGKNTFQQEILQKAGIENIFGEQEGWIKVSEEEILKQNPDIIVTTVNYADDPIAEIKSRQGWDSLDAVKNDKVFFLDPDIMSRPGPRIGEAVELAAKIAYPELF